MNSKGHLYCSILKSILRIVGCLSSIILVLVTTNIKLALVVFSLLLLAAELLGILEELLDKR